MYVVYGIAVSFKHVHCTGTEQTISVRIYVHTMEDRIMEIRRARKHKQHSALAHTQPENLFV